MTLTRRFQLARAAVSAGALGLAFAAAYATSSAAVFALGVPVAWLLRVRAGGWVVRPVMRRFAAAVEADAWSDARACLAELRGLYGAHPAPAWLDAYETTLLIGEGRYPDALALLSSIDRARLHPSWHPWMLNNLAFTLAHTGDGPRAVTVARESLDLSQAHATKPSAELRSSQLATLGAALVVAGKPEEGMALLEEVLAGSGRPRALSARWFFLGEALRAMGRNEDAVAAYRRSRDVSRSSPHAGKASAALEAMSIYR